MIDRENLPDDVPALKSIIYQLLDVVAEQKLIIAALNKKVEEQDKRIGQLTHQVNTLLRHRYGRRSERTVRVKAANDTDKGEEKEGHGRRLLPQDLPREKTTHEIEANERVCEGCGDFLSKIGEVVSEQLEAVPLKFYVKEHVRFKYACRRCQDKVILAKMPNQPIDKGIGSAGVLAEVLVNKYQDHLPLYRQSQKFKRYGIDLSRSTLCGWVMECAALLSPLVEVMKERALIPCRHLFSDDTPIRVLCREEGKAKTGRFWIYTSKGNEKYPACTVYEYTPTRQAEGPINFLKGFGGFLQADAYAGYDQVYKEEEGNSSVTEVGCWGHARRKFYEVAQASTKEGLADEGLSFIKTLYNLERETKVQALSGEEIKKWRDNHSRPVLESFHRWLIYQKGRILPKSPLGEAISYTLNHWKALNNYLLEGHLEIDNNRAERGIRPLALGRKNYLFVGSHKGGRAGAVTYSLLETCKQHRVNPIDYLRDVLARLPTHPYSRVEELLPYNWSPPQEENTPLLAFAEAA